MKIAIHASDLDSKRIDGTRVYILNLLKNFGKISPNDEFIIYHKGEFNPALTPPNFQNYKLKKIKNFPFWTQTSLAWAIWKDRPDCLWLPATNIPILRRRSMRVVVTIHDMAYMYFPKMFPKKDLFKLKTFSKLTAKLADGIIAVSESTKKDILKFNRNTKEKEIKVVYHGFDKKLFENEAPQEQSDKLLGGLKLKKSEYILYVGAIQPRKNLAVLLRAFEKIKVKNGNSNLKLVIAGEKAWMWEGFLKKVESSEFKSDIILTGEISFSDLPILYKNALFFVVPSLYEGFGMILLEAFASKVPVISAKNSSLVEVGGDSVLYFDAQKDLELVEKMELLIKNKDLRERLSYKGYERLDHFSWKKSAEQTLDFIKGNE